MKKKHLCQKFILFIRELQIVSLTQERLEHFLVATDHNNTNELGGK